MTADASDASVTEWFVGLKGREAEAARRLWERYAVRLVELARRSMKGVPRRTADEEDVALSVFHSLCAGAAEGRFADLRSRDELWWLLLTITRQKVVDHIRRSSARRRGGGQTVLGGELFRDIVSRDPAPEDVVILDEEFRRLMGLLRDDGLRRVAALRIEGYTDKEIAESLGVSVRTVERKFGVIRRRWERELAR